jgi:hypothetical protein
MVCTGASTHRRRALTRSGARAPKKPTRSASKALSRYSRNRRRKRRASTRTGRKKLRRQAIHRLPSAERPPPATTQNERTARRCRHRGGHTPTGRGPLRVPRSRRRRGDGHRRAARVLSRAGSRRGAVLTRLVGRDEEIDLLPPQTVRFGLSNSMLGCGPTTPQSYPEWSGFGR